MVERIKIVFDVVVHRSNFMFFVLLNLVSDTATVSVYMRKRMMVILFCRSQGKEEEAERMLKESIRFGPHFADAYSSLASLYADQVLLSVICFCFRK